MEPVARGGAAERPDELGIALGRWAALLGALAVVSVLHYATSADQAWLHNVYQRLYYAPIVVGAYWFGVRGGLLTALFAAVAYIPHIRHTWGTNAPYAASQYVELVIFHAAGLLVGLLSDYQRRLARKYQDTAASLEAANRELRESQEQVRRADRLSALGEFAAGLAHEIRNPLAGIKGALEIVASRVAAGTPEAEFTGVAATELTRLDNLVGEFLSYARPRPPELRAASLDDLVDQVVLLLRPQAERGGVTVRLDTRSPLPPVAIDPEQVRQVLFNVLLNAIEASPREGILNIRSGIRADRVYIEATDQGPGIARENRARVFDPFFTTKAHGTGLGLAVSQRIIAAHGGDIGIEDGPSQGTTVRISLPVPGQPAAPSA